MRDQHVVLLCGLLLCVFGTVSSKPPHIVFILADDLGWNDVGFHNPSMKTPNIDKLATEGVILNSSYVQPVCTPSRHSIMTGVYPFKAGLQNGVIAPNRPEYSPLKYEFLPQKLKTLGYATHMVGKWHLGSCKWECTPTYRGFDSFLGYYNGAEDYYNKTIANGFDFRDGKDPVKNDTYSAFIYAERAQKIISTHNKSQPLFLYLPFQNVHNPIEVPKKYEDLYPNIKTDGRRQYCGMVSILDEAIGNITESLKENGLFEDTVIIFSTDNGGIPTGFGNNYPLRGAKTTVFEGGTRAVAFVHGAGLQKTGYTYNGLIHAVDWHPTVVSIAGGTTETEMDGVSQWKAIRTDSESNRTWLVYNLDESRTPVTGAMAIRYGDFKLIQGYPGYFQDWYKPDQFHDSYSWEDSQDENEIYRRLAMKDLYGEDGKLKIWGDGLYNLKDDPNEHNDVSEKYPDIVDKIKAKLEEYKKDYVPPNHPPPDKKSDPSNFGGFWSPGWC